MTTAISPNWADLIHKASAADQYKRAIRGAVRGYWSGQTNFVGFYDTMELAITRMFMLAWMEGARACGVRPDEMTRAERLVVRRYAQDEFAFIQNFADDIEAGSKRNKGKLAPLMKRVDLWIARLRGISEHAKTIACKDKKLKWVRHADDSCSSCLKLDGKVYRASTWAKYDLHPQSLHLECMQGANGTPVCKCTFQQTDEPVTGARPPQV